MAYSDPKPPALTGSLFEALSPRLFARPTPLVASLLVGRLVIVQQQDGSLRIDLLTETEAYLGAEDAASHARFGPTQRTRIMFETTAHWYLYFIYGMHTLANITTDKDGAGAVLLRATAHASGPARLVRLLGLSQHLHLGKPVAPESGAWISRFRFTPTRIQALPRVGIAYAHPKWREAPLRFVGEWRQSPAKMLASLLQRHDEQVRRLRVLPPHASPTQ